MGTPRYTAAQLDEVQRLYLSGLEWAEVAAAFNRKFGTDHSPNALRCALARVTADDDDDAVDTRLVRKTLSAQKGAAIARRNARNLAASQELQGDILSRMQEIVATKGLEKLSRAPTLERDPHKRNMTLELMVTDVHVGKRTRTFNTDVLENRLEQLVTSTIAEMERNEPIYNLDRLIVYLGGDIIENAEMHGLESARGCEYGNAEQCERAIRLLFYKLLAPLARTGVPITVIAVPGNHDRAGPEKSFHETGKTYLTWVIYSAMEMLSQAHGLGDTVTWKIATGPNHVEDIYGCGANYEHGDIAKALTRDSYERLMARRQQQAGRTLHFMRLGHWHEYTVFGRGTIIVNGCIPGADSYSEALGFDTQACQVLNEYVETTNRPTCFFRSFPIYLR